jgi:hypothetical protein
MRSAHSYGVQLRVRRNAHFPGWDASHSDSNLFPSRDSLCKVLRTRHGSAGVINLILTMLCSSRTLLKDAAFCNEWPAFESDGLNFVSGPDSFSWGFWLRCYCR